MQRPAEEESSCRYLTPGSFGLTHVPVARALSLAPSRTVPLCSTNARRTRFSEAKTNVGELLEGHSHRFCSIATPFLSFSPLSYLLSFLPFFPLRCLTLRSFSFSLSCHPSPVDPIFTARIEAAFTMLFRHRVLTPTTRLDATQRRIDGTQSLFTALNDSAG